MSISFLAYRKQILGPSLCKTTVFFTVSFSGYKDREAFTRILMRGFFPARNLLEETTFQLNETQSSRRARSSHAWIIWANRSKNYFYVHNWLDTMDIGRGGDHADTRVGTLIVATIFLQLIQNRYMFRSFTILQCSHQHCVQPVASDVEVVGYL